MKNKIIALASFVLGLALVAGASIASAYIYNPSSGGGSGTPGGSNTQVQYNNAGSFAGAANLIYSSGNVGVATTSPYAQFSVSGTTVLSGSDIEMGTTSPNNTNCTTPSDTSQTCVEVVGSDNSTGGVQLGTENVNGGANAYNGFFLNNDLASDNLVDHFGFLGQNSSHYNSTTFGSAFNQANLVFLQNTDGPLSFVASTSTSPGYINFFTNCTGSPCLPSTAQERVRIDGSGNLGVGSTSPWGLFSIYPVAGQVAPIMAVGSTTATVFGIYPNPLAFSNASTITTGSVGISDVGAPRPYGLFTVAHTSGTQFAGVSFNGGPLVNGIAGYQTFNFVNSATGSNQNCGKSRGVTAGSFTAVQSADLLCSILYYGADGATIKQTGRFDYAVDGSVSSGVVPGRFMWTTQYTDGTNREVMRLDSAGRLGIGTTTLSSLLSVGVSPIDGTATTTIYMDSGTGKGTCLVMKDVTTGSYVYITVKSGALNASATSCM